MNPADEREMDEFYRVSAPSYDDDWGPTHEGMHVSFYCALAQEAVGPVLEMGCGTGLVLLAAARAGATVHGMERSAAMLEQLTAKLAAESPEVRARVAVTRGDIRWDRVPGAFALVTAPGHVISTFVERDDQRAFLRNVRCHLAPGGAFVFDVFQPDYRRIAQPSEEFVRDEPGRQRWTIRNEQQPEWQIIRCTVRWLGAGGEERMASIRQRWFTHAELLNLLELEGFRVTDEWGRFAREPFGPGSPLQVFRAVAAG